MLAAPGPSAPAKGFADNAGYGDRKVLLERILPDLRVHVDVDTADMPYNDRGKLTREEVESAVWLGIGNWISIMPQAHFRMVPLPESANLVIRFRKYDNHIPGGATGCAFLPWDWRPPPPGPAAFDFACGAKEFGKLPSGAPCWENSNNIIMFQVRGMAFRRVDFLDSRMHHEYTVSKTDRSDSTRAFFRFLPDPHFKTWPPDRSTCVSGAPRAGVYPTLDLVCVEEKYWPTLKHYDKFGAVEGPYDIASMVEHEFGHTLVGDHTFQSGRCMTLQGEDYAAFDREPVVLENKAIRRVTWQQGGDSVSSYSTLFPGNGFDAAWNIRGMFEVDAQRLASGSLDLACRSTGVWKGFPTSYPKISGWIILQKPNGSTKYVDDWRYACRLMGWPLSDGRPMTGEWFQTGLLLK